MNDEQFKHRYSIILLALTLAWAAFCVFMTYRAITRELTGDILVTAGANVLLGALINWMGNVNQFWFRKAKPDDDQLPSPVEGEGQGQGETK